MVIDALSFMLVHLSGDFIFFNSPFLPKGTEYEYIIAGHVKPPSVYIGPS
jgi:hypothetical protein